MDNLMLRRRLLMAAQGVWTTITATTPFALQNALKSKMRSLIQYGKMVQDGTPTPDAPVYPTINNGTVQMVHRSGLPSGYKLLEYVGSSGSAYVVTDVFLASTDVVEAEFRNNSTTGYGSLYGVFKLGDSSALYANQTYYGYDESNNKVDTDLRVNTDWHSSRHDFVNGTLTIDDTTVTFTPFEFANSVQNAVLARYNNNSYGYIWMGYIRKFKVTRGGEVICDLLPAKNEQDEAGLYDLISGTFYTATSGTLVSGDEVNDYESVVVGTPEVLTINGIATIAEADIVANTGLNSTVGDPFINTNRCYTGFGYFPAGTNFIIRSKANSMGGYLFQYSANNAVAANFISSIRMGDAVEADGWYERRATTTQDAWLFAQYGAKKATAISDEWSALMPRATASVPMLLSVGDYRDEVDLVSGTVTRRVGIYVFTGEEDFFLQTGNGNTYFRANFSTDFATSTGNGNGFCTHFPCGVSIGLGNTTQGIQFWKYTAGNGKTSVGLRCDDLFTATSENITPLKTWFAAQYAQGTPVIVWYPLATPTTESLTPQELSTVKGNNVINATSDIAPFDVSVTYRARK